MKTQYVIDTNVVMDDQTNFWKYFIEGNDLNGNNFEILIPQIVNEELDGLKKDNTSNKGYYQRKQTQKLFLKMDKFDIIPDIKKGIAERFNYVTPDNIILNTILELQKETKNTKYVLYTNDLMMLLKQSKMFKIECYTDVKKIDTNFLKYNIPKIYVDPDYIEELLETGHQKNIYNWEFRYQILTTKDNPEIHEQVRLRNDVIEHVKKEGINRWNRQSKFIQPKSTEQQIFMDQMQNDDIKILTSISQSGTGKTLLQLYGQIQQLSIPDIKSRKYNKIVYIVNPSIVNHNKDLGYLPGSQHEKILPFLTGIIDNLQLLFDGEIPDEYDVVNNSKSDLFEIRPINYIRGSSINKQIVIQDEQQNYTQHELRTLVQRVSNNSKLVLLGDVNQIDEKMQVDYSGIVRLLAQMEEHKHEIPYINVYMTDQIRNDIVNIMKEFFNVI